MGVDVFVVISGSRITSIILHEMAAGTFTLKKFYERRALRILPALFLVTAVGLPLAWFIMLPAEMQVFARSIVGVSLLSSNFLVLERKWLFRH